MRAVRLWFVCLLFIITAAQRVSAFALIGRYAPWMTSSNGFGNDIGGPVNIGQGYRWNVPLITYAYDQSFLDFFGATGVAAVDSVIQTLNNLPPASTLDPNSYPTNAFIFLQLNSPPNVLDLKSEALSLMLRQMGLASPEHYVYCLHDYSISNNVTNFDIVTRNFDPLTFQPSTNINDNPISYQITALRGGGFTASPAGAYLQNASAAGFADYSFVNFAVESLTYDDVGGLRYLLSTNTVALEGLIPGVQGAGANAGNYVNTALRPGIDKVTFEKVDFDPFLGQLFTPITNQWVDSYYSNGVVQHQNLQRVITQPDIIFTAADINSLFAMSSVSNWADNALPGNQGPGVIQPPIKITFDRFCNGLYWDNNGLPIALTLVALPPWGSFDIVTNGTSVSTTNVVRYPTGLGSAIATTFNLHLLSDGASVFDVRQQFSWSLPGAPGTQFLVQASTNLSTWTNLTPVTNNGWSITYSEVLTNTSPRFFRTIPQPQ